MQPQNSLLQSFDLKGSTFKRNVIKVNLLKRDPDEKDDQHLLNQDKEEEKLPSKLRQFLKNNHQPLKDLDYIRLQQ